MVWAKVLSAPSLQHRASRLILLDPSATTTFYKNKTIQHAPSEVHWSCGPVYFFSAFGLLCPTINNAFSESRHWWRAVIIILTWVMHIHTHLAKNCTCSIISEKFVPSSLLSVPVAHLSPALLQTYLWMVSSAWLAWSKCPPLHPCCHRGNQADQTTQRVMVLDFHVVIAWSESASPALNLVVFFPVRSLLSPAPAALRSATEARLFSLDSDLFL